MSMQRYAPSNTTLHDLYKLYNPFAYPYEYTQKMMNDFTQLVDQSVERSINRYFEQVDIPEPVLSDRGRYYELTSTVHGIKPEDMHIQYQNGKLLIQGKKEDKSTSSDGTTQTYSYRAFSKVMDAPKTTKNISAQMSGPRLTITIPKE